MALMGLFRGRGPSGFGWSSTAQEVVEGLDLSGTRILITGSNSGIGLETLRVLAERGATVFAAARSQKKAQGACDEVGGETIPVVCELSDPVSVRACAEEVRRQGGALDGIIANAGIMALPERETAFGYEKQFFVNHVGHFLLVTELLDELTDTARVVVVASDAHKGAAREGIEFDDLSFQRNYSGWRAYCHSKLANILFARELGRRFEEQQSDRIALSVHPGPIDTNLTRYMGTIAKAGWAAMKPFFLKTIPEGAATQTWAAVHPDASEYNGEYLANCNVAKTTRAGADQEMARQLWEVTQGIIMELDAAIDSEE